jgi:hypothetical protein
MLRASEVDGRISDTIAESAASAEKANGMSIKCESDRMSALDKWRHADVGISVFHCAESVS